MLRSRRTPHRAFPHTRVKSRSIARLYTLNVRICFVWIDAARDAISQTLIFVRLKSGARFIGHTLRKLPAFLAATSRFIAHQALILYTIS